MNRITTKTAYGNHCMALFYKEMEMGGFAYKYETHLHTSEASACAVCTGAEHARHYKEMGYKGIMITDHFFNGNTCVPLYLPWEEMINWFCQGYENAKREGERIGLSVFFGWESNYKGTEFLIYGLGKEWLLKHPQILDWSVEEQYEYVSRDGGMVVQAHPFREAPFISKIRLFPNHVDAVEAVNISNDKRDVNYNIRALRYAEQYGLPITGGSDEHGKSNLCGGMVFGEPLRDIQDFIQTVMERREYKVITSSGLYF